MKPLHFNAAVIGAAVALALIVTFVPEAHTLVAGLTDPSILILAPAAAATLKSKREELQAKQDQLHKVFEEAKTEGGDLDFDKVKVLGAELSTTAKAEKVRAMNTELTDLGKECEALELAEKALRDAAKRASERTPIRHPSADDGDQRRNERKQTKSLGQLVTESERYKGGELKLNKGEIEVDVEVKTLMETGAGFAPEVTRTGRLVESAQRPIQVIDLIPSNTTSQAAVKYMEETTAVGNAEEVAEGDTYGEAQFVFAEKISPVQKIGAWLPITDEQLEDVPMLEGIINRRLVFFVRQRVDGQILVGDGIAPNLRGILSVVGIGSQAKGADAIPDAVYKAITKVRVTGRAIPGGVVFHPTNWQDVRLLRTVDGVYIWGNPSEAGPERIWGLPVVQSDGITLGKAVVGDWANFSELNWRRGVVVKVSDSHSDFFIKGKQAIRADVRGAIVFYRPAAFCEVTGL